MAAQDSLGSSYRQLETQLAALAPIVAPQPLPRVLARTGMARGGVLAALSSLCADKRQRDALAAAILSARQDPSCNAYGDDAVLSIFGQLRSDCKCFDVHRLAFLPAARGRLRDLSELLELQATSMRATGGMRADALDAARHFDDLNSGGGTSNDGTVVTARLQEVLAIAYAQQVLLRSSRGLRVTLCGNSLPFTRGTDVGEIMQSALAGGSESTSKTEKSGGLKGATDTKRQRRRKRKGGKDQSDDVTQDKRQGKALVMGNAPVESKSRRKRRKRGQRG